MPEDSPLMAGLSRLLNKQGDALLFGSVRKTPPITANPAADTGIHTAVPHRYLCAYLLAIKSLLRYDADLAVYVHDDGTLTEEDKSLIRQHVVHARIVDRHWANARFAETVKDDFLGKVRSSYTSYLKLFDPTLVTTCRRIIVVDTDVLFLRRPDEIVDWAHTGGGPWFHRSGPWRRPVSKATPSASASANKHIQQLVVESIPAINDALGRTFSFVHGFNSGLIGYDHDTIRYTDLKLLLLYLHQRFGDRIFRWGSEQTMHGLMLCGAGARELPMDRYMVFTDFSRDQVSAATFAHFIGEFRYHGLQYPRLARKVVRELLH